MGRPRSRVTERIASQFALPAQPLAPGERRVDERPSGEGSWLKTVFLVVAGLAAFTGYLALCHALGLPIRAVVGSIALAVAGVAAWAGWSLFSERDDPRLERLRAALLGVFVAYAVGGWVLALPFGWPAHLASWSCLAAGLVLGLIHDRRERITEWPSLRASERAATQKAGTPTPDVADKPTPEH